MLILTRKPGERIFIGNNQEICITVLGTKGCHVRIGIDAHKDLSIVREEVFLRGCEQLGYSQEILEEEEDYPDL